jgi:hypothetical protein
MNEEHKWVIVQINIYGENGYVSKLKVISN